MNAFPFEFLYYTKDKKPSSREPASLPKGKDRLIIDRKSVV